MLFNYTFIYIYAQYTILVVFAGHLNDTYCAGVIFGCVPPDGGRFLIASRHYIYIYADMSNGAVLLCISLYISAEINSM